MTQFLDTPVDKSLGTPVTWLDIDLSSDVPVNATGAIFRIVNGDSTNARDYGLRKKGSTDNRHYNLRNGSHHYAIVGLDANRKCQGDIESILVDFFLIGYTETDATFFTNAVDKSMSVSGVWTDIDLSGDVAAGTVAAIFEVINTGSTSAKEFGLRKNGSADNRHKDVFEYHHNYMIVGVDANRKCEGWIESNDVDFYLLGYLTMGQAETNAHNRSLGTTGSYVDIDESGNAPSGATGVFGELFAPNMNNYGARKNGTSFDYYKKGMRHDSLMVGLDANQKWEGKIDNTGLDFYTMGYFARVEVKTKESSVGLQVVDRKSKASSMGLSVQETNTKASSVGVSVQETNTKASSVGLTVIERQTKASSVGLTVIERQTKASSVGLTVIERQTKASSIGLTVQETNTKASSISLSVRAEGTKVSTLGLTLANQKRRYSSLGVTITGSNTKTSSLGLGVEEINTHESSLSVSVVDTATKASTAGLRIVDRHIKESSASLTVKATYTKESSVGLCIVTPQSKASSIGLTISGANTIVSSICLTIYELALKKGLFYAKLGDTILEAIEPESFRISEEINRIPSYEFEVANSEVNRAAIAANPTALLKIYWQHHGLENHIFTGIINADGIEYVSLTNIRITGFSSYVKLGWPLFKHLNAEDAEPVNKVFVFDGTYTDYTDNANSDLEIILDSMDSTTNWSLNNGMSDITVNTTEKKEGSGALNLIKANTSTYFASILKTISSTNLISKHVKVWLYIKDIATKNKISRAEINLLDSNVKVSEWHFPVSGLSVGWNLLVVDTESTPNYTENPDLTDICEIQLGVNTNLATDTYAEGDVISDYYRYSSYIPVSFNNINHALYIGEANPFWGLQVKYSTKGVPGNAVTIIEYSKGSGIWAELNVLDETYAFTEAPGTYDIIIAHPPSDWARNTIDGVSKFWIRWRVVSGTYTTSPKLDKIHTVNVDVYRVFYLATSARAILLDALEDTGYSMDPIDTCPEDEINLYAEYESPLRVIAAIPAALTWTDIDGSKKSYQWWIDEAKKVHMKQKRGTTHSDDITGDLTIFNNLLDYFNVSNRLIGFAKRDGLSQIRAIVEDKPSQVTHALRELAVAKTDVGKYITLKESLEKDIAISKDPMQRLKGSVTTEFWGKRGYEVGDTVTLHQGEWVVEEGEFQIVKVDRGPVLTQLNLGISREHLEGLKSNLKRSFDLNNIQMHGSTSLLTAGPETSNYERKSDGSVFSAKLKIEIPSEVVKTHKVLLSWTIGPYRASVNEQTSGGVGHDHGGFSGAGGATGGGFAGAGGAFTPDVLDGGDFIPAMLSEAHQHDLSDTLTIDYGEIIINSVGNEGVIEGMNHRHSTPSSWTSEPDGTDYAINGLEYGCNCSEACGGGSCVSDEHYASFASDNHGHYVSGGNSGYTSPNAYIEHHPISVVFTIHPYVLQTTSNEESPAHLHDGVYEPVHGHAGVTELPHNDHSIPAEPAHEDHIIVTEPGGSVDISFGVHEEAAGTVLELLINNNVIDEYSGDQTEIRVDGYLSSGTNTIEIQPVAAETGKKGSATISASGILFIEPKKF
jgi:hypothetical protein